MNPLNQLAELGQSFWYDNIQRSLLKNGTIERMIDGDSLTGLTSNPTIFHKAISRSNDYDRAIVDLMAQEGQGAGLDLYESLAIRDIPYATTTTSIIDSILKASDNYHYTL